MPKATAGGSSNAWEANEPGYVPVVAEVAPAEPAVAPEPTPEPEPVQAVSEPPAATKPKAAPKPSGPDVTVTVT